MGFLTLLVIGGTIYGLTQLFSEKRSLERDKNFKKYMKYLEETSKVPDHYLSLAERESISNKKVKDATATLGIDCSKYLAPTITLLERINEQYIAKQQQDNVMFFNNIMGYSLDKQQRDAILRDETYQLVLAGAGSGKTLTIVGKVAYLCAKKKIKPEEILLISFTNKAAEEMINRVSKQLGTPMMAYTFHKLGLEIIRKKSHNLPNVADENVLNDIINEYYEKSVGTINLFANKLLTFLAYYLYVPADKQKFKTFGAFIEAEKGNDLETLKSKYEKRKGLRDKLSIHGEVMKSQEEVIIANFLFLNGIKYKYEYPYPHTTFSYKPDFYLPDYDIYWEHFGIDRDGKCNWLSQIEAQKYVENMNNKREIHKKFNTKLIETYSYYQKEGILLQKLEEILKANDIKKQPITKRTILKEIFFREDRGLKEFNTLISSFIRLFKAQGYTTNAFNNIISQFPEKTYLRKRCELFFSIVSEIYTKYCESLNETNSIDFSDMIAKATEIINNGSYNLPYKYVIIDEYQDIGYDRYRLVKAILENTKAKLVCIGDDWQSIYRFNGSDVNLITSFDSYWGKGYLSKIEKTYRNSQELIDISAQFVMKNPKQKQKKLYSDKRNENPIKIVHYRYDNHVECLKSILNEIYINFGKSKVLLLGRNNYDIEFLDDEDISDFTVINNTSGIKVKYDKYPELDISFLTVHKSKGLEADNVIIINCKNEYLGFPNKIADDLMLQLLLSSNDSFYYAEERRLMYVALTRTKNNTYLLVPEKDPSEFVIEIKEIIEKTLTSRNTSPTSDTIIKKTNEEVTFHCPKCKTGKLVKREKNGKTFYGCSNYPKCDYICNQPSELICPRCGGFMVVRESKYGKFYGCSNYPLCRQTFDITPRRTRSFSHYARKSHRRRWK